MERVLNNPLSSSTLRFPGMKLYTRLERVKWLRKYSRKFLFVAFLGIHLPLIGLLIFALTTNYFSIPAVIFTVLGSTLIATLLTLTMLNKLLEPLFMAQDSLREFCAYGIEPELPTHFKDEAGVLMRDISVTINKLTSTLSEKQDLMRLLGHDLRTPAINTISLAELIDKNNTPDEIQTIKRDLQRSADQSLHMINQILEWLEGEDQASSMGSPVQLESMVIESIKSVFAIARKKNIEISYDISSNLSTRIVPSALSRVIQNLLVNAIKFSDPGKQVEVVIERNEGDIKISVHDHGVGFSPEQEERLFDKFTEMSRQGTEGEASTGLGLYLSKKLVRNMRGDIHAHSAGPGQGAAFIVSIPID